MPICLRFPRSLLRPWRWLATGLCAALLAACGGGGGDEGPTPPPPPPTPDTVSAVIGPAGGTVTGSDGVQVIVPPGALREDTRIAITRHADDGPQFDLALATPPTVYAFTPHGLVFDQPVTVRMPVPAGATAPRALFAASGADWSEQDTVAEAGFLNVQRNTFSWGTVYWGQGCTGSADGNPDWCFVPWGTTAVAATPASALIPLQTPGPHSAGSYRLDAAAALSVTATYVMYPSCVTAQLRLVRRKLDVPSAVLETLATAQSSLQIGGHPWSTRGAAGSTTFAPIALDHRDAGRHAYGVYVSCTRSNGQTREFGESLVLHIAVPTPTVLHTVGGSVSGLTGTGLVLRNNGGDDLAVAADGSFRFATAIGAETPYDVTVAAAPAGQRCTVANGSGTASADVRNVTVSCSTAPGGARTWQPAAPLPPAASGSATEPQLAVAADGSATALWLQASGLWSSRYTPAGGWGAAQRVDNASSSVPRAPRVAVDGQGHAMALWVQADANDTARLAIWASHHDGSGWSTRQIDEGSEHAGEPELAADPVGNFMAVWSEQVSGSSRIRARRFVAGDGWSSGPMPVDGGIGRATTPRVAMDGNGMAIAVWTQYDGTRERIVANRFNGIGWSTADTIDASNTGEHSDPQLVGNAAGQAIVAWIHRGSATPQLLARSYTPSTGWSGTVQPLNIGAASPLAHRLALNSQGQAMALWQEGIGDVNTLWSRSYQTTTGWNGTVQQVDAALPATDAMARLCLASDAGGDAIAVWSHKAAGGHRDLYASRWSRAGSAWSSATLLETDDSGSMGVDQCGLGTDAGGNAVALWNQAGSDDVFRLHSSLFR